MTGRSTAFLWASGAPREIEPLLGALRDAFEAFGEEPARMFVSAPSLRHTVYEAARFAKAMRSEQTTSVLVKGVGDARVSVDLYLRDDPRYDERLLERRHVRLVAPTIAPDDPRLIEFLEVACATYPVAHGGVVQAAMPYHSAAESILVSSSKIGPDAERRIAFDSANAPGALHLLRRLYPVTIVGSAIWATLPPPPADEPPLVVRDLADCKMIMAWPTLVDAHDPQFLLGTRALRRWLWPHTIQNPADEPGEIDHRLKWLELLPW